MEATLLDYRFLQIAIFACVSTSTLLRADEPSQYRWTLGAPLLNRTAEDGGTSHRLFDPTAIWADEMWHVFAGGPRYFAVKELIPGAIATSMKIPISDLIVPQVFLFRPTKQWQMIGQRSEGMSHLLLKLLMVSLVKT